MIDPKSNHAANAAKLRQEQRLAAALRENLKRRKAQIRQRAAAAEPAAAPGDETG